VNLAALAPLAREAGIDHEQLFGRLQQVADDRNPNAGAPAALEDRKPPARKGLDATWPEIVDGVIAGDVESIPPTQGLGIEGSTERWGQDPSIAQALELHCSSCRAMTTRWTWLVPS
jgi:hypothetical protein